jgi:hypothetical protein
MLTATGTSNMRTSSIVFFVFFAAIAAISAVQGQAMGSCTAALKPVFTTTQGYQCVQLTITNTNFNTSSVTYSQGNLYFNHYLGWSTATCPPFLSSPTRPSPAIKVLPTTLHVHFAFIFTVLLFAWLTVVCVCGGQATASHSVHRRLAPTWP